MIAAAIALIEIPHRNEKKKDDEERQKILEEIERLKKEKISLKEVKQIMAKHTNKVKVNIPVLIACFLFCLTLISVHLTSGLYAKYINFCFRQ